MNQTVMPAKASPRGGSAPSSRAKGAITPNISAAAAHLILRVRCIGCPILNHRCDPPPCDRFAIVETDWVGDKWDSSSFMPMIWCLVSVPFALEENPDLC
jgi:hypothetical protein